mgnify:FL=1|jgi:small subunit ribosomal protein S21|tara:strand:- start:239 stop:487 length:249 start_codon:yes stop_codon:yes gene_type:complete
MDRDNRRPKRREPKENRGLQVDVHGNDVARALRKLKKMIANDGMLKELRDREAYEKPSLKRKKAKAAARKRHLKDQAKKEEK